jgi:hypothetical protein
MLLRRPVRAITWVAVAATLAACNLGKAAAPTADVNALYTAAAATLVAQLNDQQTQTAQAVSPTPLTSPTPLASFTPLPTFPVGAGLTPFVTPFMFGTPGTPGTGVTPLASSPAGPVTSGYAVGCNNAVFLGETIPDGTKMNPQHDFDKKWSLQNTGTCTWDEGYVFAFKSGEQMGGPNDVKIVYSEDFTPPNHSIAFKVHLYAPKVAGEYKGYWQMKNDAGQWFGSLVSVDIIVQ